MNVVDKFSLQGKVAIITGGAGLLGRKHADVIAEMGGTPILFDINEDILNKTVENISRSHRCDCRGYAVDITSHEDMAKAVGKVKKEFRKINILINNAANNPEVSQKEGPGWTRFEKFSLDIWNKDIAVNLTGAFISSQIIGSIMADNSGGVILNVASDLGVIAPDQRIYRNEKLADDEQPVKPVTYSVTKHALIGLTKYLATYWANKKIRVNSISPGGVYTDQADDFVKKLTNLIPLGRMADQDEYKAAVLFLISDASSYMTGANLIIDGGRTCW